MLIWQSTRVRHWAGTASGIAAAFLLFAACAESPEVATSRISTSGTTDTVRRASFEIEPVSLPQTTTTLPASSVEIEPAGPQIPTVPLDPTEVASAWREGVGLFESGDYAGAIVPLQIAADGRAEEPYAHYLLGLALWKAGENESAERFLVRSSELDGGSVRTWVNLARVRMDRDDPRGTLDATGSALAIDASSADALHQRGRALAALDRTDEAIETLLRANGLDPENGYVANTLGYLLIQVDRPQEAMPFLESASERLPEVAYVRNNLGVASERTGAIERAVQEYHAAVEAGDPDGKAASSIARLQPLFDRIIAEKGSGADVEEPEPVPSGEQQASK